MKPNRAVPPSAYLEEWIEDNRMDIDGFTDSSGLNPEDVNAMVRTGSLPYPGFAEELGKATDIPASAWKELQERYGDDRGRTNQRKRKQVNHCRIRTKNRIQRKGI